MLNVRKETIDFIKDHEIFRSNLSWKTNWIHVTTITFTSKMNRELDLVKIRNHFESEAPMAGPFPWSLKGADAKADFYNQLTIKYVDDFSTKSVKLFTNGSIQVAGAVDLFDCERILAHTAQLLKGATGLTYILQDGFKVAMINTNFNLNFHVNLIEIQNIFNGICRVAFDPDRYSAVKLKFVPGPNMKQVTASVFGTGKIIVTGAAQLSEIVHSYHFITSHIQEHLEKAKLGEIAVADETSMFMGAPWTKWVEYISQ